MIKPLACAVDEDVFNAVKALCGEELAMELCYVDEELYKEVKTIVDIIHNGFLPGGIEKRSDVS